MLSSESKTYRKYGYDVLINNFEAELRQFLAREVFLVNFGKAWKDNVPTSIFQEDDLERLSELRTNASVEEYFDELTILHLKKVILTGDFFSDSKEFIGTIDKAKFDAVMNELNILRRKIAHAKLSFGYQDFQTLLDKVLMVCGGPASAEIIEYIKAEKYKSVGEIPKSFFEEYDIPNNLPFEDFDLDGGFVGRDKEIRELRKLVYSNEDRVLTIIGAGGVGKTALALKLAHEIILDTENPFNAVMWFSAKENKLTDTGIMPLQPGIKSEMQFVEEIAKILDERQASALKDAKVDFEGFKNFIYEAFKKSRVLLIVDNLETIYKNEPITEFIKNVPRLSQVLITSRRGLGEIERRYQLSNLNNRDATRLFRLVSKERNREDLLSLKEEYIEGLCKKVKNYPLLIKWSIGQVCLGKELDKSFSVILEGTSEIAQFVFNDVFELLSPASKIILYSLIVYGNKPMRKPILANISKLGGDELEEAIRELNLSSLIISEIVDQENTAETVYYMLDLTMGFVDTKLQSDEKTLMQLHNNMYHLIDQIKEEEIAIRSYSQSLVSFGVKTEDDRIAFLHVKSAKNYELKGDSKEAEHYFKEAISVSPRFAYALTEYAKFEFYRGFHSKALNLMKQAVDFNPDNFLAWLTFGKMLRKSRQYENAIRTLLKAKDLNPQYLPVYNELGRTYTITGELDKAEKEFEQALTDQKYPNIRHKVITLQFLADNFRRKGEGCRNRKDSEGEIKNFERALSTIDEAMKLSPRDTKLPFLRSRLLIDLGVAFSRTGKITDGNNYLNEALKPTGPPNALILPSNEAICEVSYYLAVFNGGARLISNNEIEKLIRRGYGSCPPDSKWISKFKGLEADLLGSTGQISKAPVSYGIIKSFNSIRKFGIIESNGQGFLFFPNCFARYTSPNDIQNSRGKSVSFIPTEQYAKYVAKQVELLE